MKRLDQERSQHVGKMIDQTMVKAFGVESADVLVLFDACCSSLFSETQDKVERTEIARRIAEAKISILYQLENVGDDFRSSWAEINGLGFSSIEREASMLFYYLKYCARANDKDDLDLDAQSAISRLETLIAQMVASGDETLAGHFETVRDQFTSNRVQNQ